MSLPAPARIGAGPFGRTEPRIYTPPLRELTPATSLGFALVDFARDVLGITLLPWQEWLAVHALELREDGRPRFATVVVLIARQQGKSTFSQVLALFYPYVLEVALVVGAAQDVSLAKEIWEGVCQIVDDVPELTAERRGQPRTTNGQIELRLHGNRRYVVRSSNPSSARGLSSDLVIFDELRAQKDWGGWAALSATTVARPSSQLWAFSNAGDASSVVLNDLRMAAHLALGDPDRACVSAGYDEGAAGEELGWFEWSAPPGSQMLDPDAIAAANPSLGYGFVTLDRLRAAASSAREWVYRTENLCQWPAGGMEEPFPPGAWVATRLEAASPGRLGSQDRIVGDVVACIEVSWDRSRAAIVYAGRREDGRIQAEVVAYVSGAEAARDWLLSPRRGRLPSLVLLRSNAPAAPLRGDLEAAGIAVDDWKPSEVAAACGSLYDLVRGPEDDAAAVGDLRHAPHPDLDRAAQAAATRRSGDVWTWDMSRSPVDISPLYALTGAVWAVLSGRTAPVRATPAYLASNRLVVI